MNHAKLRLNYEIHGKNTSKNNYNFFVENLLPNNWLLFSVKWRYAMDNKRDVKDADFKL